MCQPIVSFILGSFRLLLFFGSLLMAILGIVLAVEITWARAFYEDLKATDWEQNLSWLFICAIYLIVLTLAGCLGAFYNNKKMIQLFGLLIIINIMVCIIVIIYLPKQEESNDKFLATLRESQKNYNWNSKIPDAIKEDTNKLWDVLQREQNCCGLQEPSDWFPYSPKNITYPKSCCDKPTNSPDGQDIYCTTVDKQKMGCLKFVYVPLFIVLMTFLSAMVVSVPLTIIACISSFKTPEYSTY